MIMKYKLLTVGLVCASSMAVCAQTTEVVEEVVLPQHTHLWYVRAQGGMGYTCGEAKFDKLLSPAFSVSVGRRFNNPLSLQLRFTRGKGKAGIPAFRKTYEWEYMQSALEAHVDLAELFAGYRPSRRFSPYTFVGVGLNAGWGNEDAVGKPGGAYTPTYTWEGTKYRSSIQAGVGCDIRVSRHVAINVETNLTMLNDKFNSKNGKTPDWMWNGLVGLTFSFGKKRQAPPPPMIDEPVIVEEDVVVEEPVKETPAPQPKKVEEPKAEKVETPAQKMEPIQENFFFERNKCVIRKQEKQKLDKLVELLQAQDGLKVLICGYADKGTGYPKYNYELSKKRADNVAKYLRDRGIAKNRITIEAKGDTSQPFKENAKNRVVICIAE